MYTTNTDIRAYKREQENISEQILQELKQEDKD